MFNDFLTPELKEHATPRQAEYIDAVLKYGSATRAAAKLGVNRRTVDRSIAAARRAALDAGMMGVLPEQSKVLLLDIETAPIMADIWAMFNEVTNIDAIVRDWYILSVGLKWLNKPGVNVMSLRNYKGYKPGSENDRALLADVHQYLCEADYVVAHNGDRFDLKKLNARFVQHGFNPPTPYKTIDTLKMAKRAFGFTSNKLDYLAKILLNKRKVKNDGLPLWQGVMAGNQESWAVMEKYNAEDVLLLEEIYLKLRSWDHLHPNINLPTSHDNMSCTVCGSANVKETGELVPVGTAGLYFGYSCKDCGHQMRGKTNVRSMTQKHAGLVNAK